VANDVTKPAEVPTRVAVIIPVYNDTIRLKKCLEALAHQEINDIHLRVIVVDNNSTDDIRSVTSDYDFVTYLHEPQPGSYHARNKALDALEDEEFIGFTDADCIPQPTWVAAAVSALRKKPNASVGGPILVFPETDGNVSTAENYEMLFAFPQKASIENENFSVTANLFISRKMFEKTGKFNCEVFSGGDYDYGQKLLCSGFPTRYVEAVAIRHPARATLTQMISRIRRCAGGSYQQRHSDEHLSKLYSWTGVVYSFRPPIRDFANIFATRDLSLSKQLKLCLLSLYLRYYRGFIYLGYKLRLLSRMERF
jgi:GT2 family glycosyltransferase